MFIPSPIPQKLGLAKGLVAWLAERFRDGSRFDDFRAVVHGRRFFGGGWMLGRGMN